jgi:predicted naringenin-chalcone synthase
MSAFINRIGTAVPAHDIHAAFVAFARTMLTDDKSRTVFDRMTERSGIAHRHSHMRPGKLDAGEVDAGGFYQRGRFPSTGARMRDYEPHALDLALAAVGQLDLGRGLAAITHVIVASCTGFTAPGLDLQLAQRLDLRPDVGRMIVGFMGCSAAVPALRAADAIVRAEPEARVLVVNVELCSLHLRETTDIETALSFLLFGDGASAALVTSDPVGVALGDFQSLIIPVSTELITWQIGDQGFEMYLSGKVPGRIADALRQAQSHNAPDGLLRGRQATEYDLWGVHAGGRTVLDAVEIGLELPRVALAPSRRVLRDFGNMSSATLMFVLAAMLDDGAVGDGMAMAFGPGMVAETFRFRLKT